ncbi:hypothetical protein [Xanthomonas sp. NCPPB 2632]|uniref:hypothetical protein n=1 Tax=Xanthomonas sp. NCPPB 2632 TaxID=3240912 RepID=UPI0035179D4E
MTAKRHTALALASLLAVAAPIAVLAQTSPAPSGAMTQAPAAASEPSKDALLQRLTARAESLSAQITTAEKSGHLSHPESTALSTKVTLVVKKARADHASQGFLSAGESASYMREFDQVQSTLGKPTSTQPKTS